MPVEFIPIETQGTIARNIDNLRDATQSPETAGIFIDTCAMVPGLDILSDPQKRTAASESLTVFPEANAMQITLEQDQQLSTEIKARFRNPEDGRNMNELSIIKTDGNRVIRLGMHFDDQELAGSNIVVIDGTDISQTVIIGKDGSVLESENIQDNIHGRQLSLRKIVSSLADIIRPADIDTLVQEALISKEPAQTDISK